MKRIISSILALFLVVSLFTIGSLAATNDVYVKDGGIGDGTSAEKPVGTLTEAFEKAAAMSGDVTIHVVDNVTLDLVSAAFTATSHTNTITVTGGKITVTTDSKNFWTLGGDTVFENITFDLNAVGMIRTLAHDVTFGEGVTMTNKAFSLRMYGYDDNLSEGSITGSATYTLLSGSFYDVSAWQKNFNTPINGTFSVIVGGTAFVNVLVTERNAQNATGTISNAIFTLDGGTIGRFVANSDNANPVGDGAIETFKIIVTKNFDINAQNTDKFPVLSGSSAALVGNAFNGVEGNGKTVLEIDSEVYDVVMTAKRPDDASANPGMLKVQTDSFDEIKKIEAPVEENPPSITPNPGTTDSMSIMIFVSVLTLTGIYAVSRKRR